ncbi:MAG: hypothetical protein QOG39_1564, partial [Acidimicrobiaceae bacterium]
DDVVSLLDLLADEATRRRATIDMDRL